MDHDPTQADNPSDEDLKKADFDDIYVRPDPRAYYQHLGRLDYQIPDHGQRVFRRLLAARRIDRPTVLDLCCSYGVTAAVLKYDVDFEELQAHYGSPELADLTSAEVAAADREFFRGRRRDHAPRVIGLDAAKPAVEYGLDAGLLDAGTAVDLEADEPSTEVAALIADADPDLITVTGGIGYITETTVEQVMDCLPNDRRPWFATLCLRTVDFTPIARTLADHGLVTDRLKGATFPQRRFKGPTERDYAYEQLAAQGLDPAGKESRGGYHTELFVSRPPAVDNEPLEDLLDDLINAA